MTKKKDLKKRVRARQEKTGERYTTARAQLTRALIPEAPSATPEALAAGLRCNAAVSGKLRALGDLRPLFARLRELLEALGAAACGPLLLGEPAPRRMPQMADWVEARRFLSQASAGTLGLSRDGTMVAFAWNDLTVVAQILLLHERKPLVVVGLLEDVVQSSPQLALLGIGRWPRLSS